MIVTPYKIIMLLFLIFAWSRVISRYKEGTVGIYGFLFWSVIWISAGILIIAPTKSDIFAHWMGVERGTDAFFSISIVVLSYLVYRLYVMVYEFERVITRLVREIALSNKKSADKKPTLSKEK